MIRHPHPRRIVVTGGAGTLGKPLVAELRRRGHTVFSLDLQHSGDPQSFRADVADMTEMAERFTASSSIDYVFHLAAEFGRLNGEDYNSRMWRTNVIGTANILSLQQRYGFRLVFASSSEVYGEAHAESMHEDSIQSTPQHPNDYALSKWVNEQQIRRWQRQHGAPSMILRFFNAYGPGEHYHQYRSVVCLFCWRLLHGLPITVYRNYRRVFMFIDDFIPTLANAVEMFQPSTVNIGGVDYRSCEELAEIVLEQTGASRDLVTFLAEEPHNTRAKRPDIERARHVLAHNPTVKLEEGIAKTLEWMRGLA